MMFDMSAQARRHYQIDRTVQFMDHKGRTITIAQGTMFWWNHHRFVACDIEQGRLECVEISRAKVNAAGAKMVPFRDGKPLALGQDEVDITPLVEPSRAGFKGKTVTF